MKKLLPLALLLATLQLQAQQTVGLFKTDSLAFDGYTLFAPITNKTTYLIDNCGQKVHSWESNLNPGMSAYLLEDGRLLRAGRIPSSFNGGGSGGRIQIFSWEGDLLWDYEHSSSTFHQHHDLEMLPNGNVLLIAWELHSVEEAEEQGNIPGSLPPGGIWSEQVVELEPIGTDSANIVWEWHLWDHLIQDHDSTKANYGIVADHPELVDLNYAPFGGAGAGNFSDWVHFNSIDYHPGLDQIVLSSRHFSEIWVIDHSTTTAEAASHEGGNSGKGGDLLYRYGNPAAYQRGNVNDQAFFGQHDASWIPDGYLGEGQIMVFNNGIGRPDGFYSTADAVQPPIDSSGKYILENGEPYGPDFFAWEFQAFPAEDMYSQNVSGATRLPNGNTLICEGVSGNFREVDFAGNLLWQYINPVGPGGPVVQGNTPNSNSVFRAYRYAPDYPAFDGRDLTPQGPIELEPLPPPSPCMATPVREERRLEGVQLSQNPVSEFLILENSSGQPVRLEVADATGRPVFSGTFAEQKISVETHGWPAGLYLIRATDVERTRGWTEKVLKI